MKFCLLLLPFLQCKTGCYRARRFTWKEICQFYNFSTLYDFVAMALVAPVKYLFSESAGSRTGEVLVSKRWWFGGERALDGASHLPRTATGFTIRTVTPDLRSKPSHRIYGQNRHTSLCCSEPKMSDPVDELSSPPSQHLCPPRLGMTGHRHIARRGMSGAARR